jgi:hypothetical protein
MGFAVHVRPPSRSRLAPTVDATTDASAPMARNLEFSITTIENCSHTIYSMNAPQLIHMTAFIGQKFDANTID